MFRRQTRLRREYIYRKTVEDQRRNIAEKKRRIKKCLEENSKIPTDLQRDALEIQKSLDWDDAGGEGITSNQDDEYKWAGVEDPKIVITTSRDPSARLKMFAKEMKLIFPNSQRLNRGRCEIKQLMEACRSNNVTDVMIFSETRGNPDGIIICHLPLGPTMYVNLSNVVMRHDVPDRDKMSEAYPHVIFHNLNSKLGLRVKNILKYLFPVPKEDSKRVMTFANQEDYISYRHHTYKKVDGTDVELTEIGPRFEMKIYSIRLGTIDAPEAADVEWELHPFMNTTRKRQFLSISKNAAATEES